MAKSKLEKFFHVESDVMVLDLDGYAEILDQHGSGIFAPMERERRAIASLMYVNSASALKALCDFAIKRAELGNEMKILGQFLTDRPDIGHCLPSDQVNDTERWPIYRLNGQPRYRACRRDIHRHVVFRVGSTKF